eukprot:TRINITY_DN15559_c0_g1_i1.p1 TRINITY_DN15559_c0_g1~~TRINITY_DN15559_c0_g1_i1.p1  ORF type:complete len:1757 (+),score=279.53 TRINITY_DN15559_c0_g1_i1:49-5271(+)
MSLRKWNNCLPNFELLQEEATRETEQVHSGILYALQAKDSFVLSHYCKRLARCKDHFYTFSVEQRIQLLQALLDFSLGASLDSSLAERLSKAILALLKGDDDLPLRISWQPLIRLIDRYFFRKNRAAKDVPLSQFSLAHLELVRQLRKYFEPGTTEAVLAHTRPLLCPHSDSIFRAIGILDSFLPTLPTESENGTPQWLSEVLAVWPWVDQSPYWDFHILSLLGRLARDRCGTVDWAPHLPLIFTHILRTFDLPVGRSGMSSAYKVAAPSPCPEAFGPTVKQSRMEVTARLIVWLVDEQGGIDHVRELLRTLCGFYHPSTKGAPTNLSEFLKNFPLHIEKRLRCEAKPDYNDRRLSVETRDALIKEFLPLCLTALYSKSGKMAQSAVLALRRLSLFDRDAVYPPLLELLRHTVSTVTEPHQIRTALECVGNLVSSLVEYEDSSVLREFLPVILDGLEANDIPKTNATLQLLLVMLSSLTLSNSANADSDDSTLEDWGAELLDRLLGMLTHFNKPPEKRGVEQVSQQHWLWVCQLLFCSVSRRVHADFCQRVLRSITSEINLNATKPLGHLCAALVLAYPESALGRLIPVLLSDFLTAADHLTDVDLAWNGPLLAACCSSAGSALLKYEPQLVQTLVPLWESDNKAHVKVACKVLRRILSTLTTVYPANLRLVPDSVWFGDGVTAKNWADQVSVQPGLVDWHLPSAAEVSMAIRLFNTFIQRPMTSLQQLTAGEAISDSSLPAVRTALKQIKKLLSGACTLLDDLPDTFRNGNDRRMRRPMCYMISELGLHEGLALAYQRQEIVQLVHSLLSNRKRLGDVKAITIGISVLSAALFAVGGEQQKATHKGGERLKNMKTLKHRTRLAPGPAEKSYPRPYAVLRSLHQLHKRWLAAPSPAYSPIHEQCLDLLIELSVGPYSQVRKAAQELAGRCSRAFPFGQTKKKILGLMSRIHTSDDEEVVKGGMFLLITPTIMWRIVIDWEMLAKFMLTLSQLREFDTASVHRRRDMLFSAVTMFFREPPVVDAFGEPARSAERVAIYNKLVTDLADVITTSQNWKYQMTAATCLKLITHPAARDDPGVMLPMPVLRLLVAQCVHEQASVRGSCIQALSYALTMLRPIIPKRTIDPASSISASGSNFLTNDDLHSIMDADIAVPCADAHRWQSAVFLDRTETGYYFLPKRLTVPDYSSGQPPAFDTAEKEEFRTHLGRTCTPDYFNKLFHLLALEPRTGNSEKRSQFFKGLFQVLGVSSVSVIDSGITTLLSDASAAVKGEKTVDENGFIGLAGEILGGLIRASKHWPVDHQHVTWDYVLQIYRQVLTTASNEGYQTFTYAAQFFLKRGPDPRRFAPLYKFVLDLLQWDSDGAGPQHRYLQTLFLLLDDEWRDPGLFDKLKLGASQMASPYDQLRQRLAAVMSQLYRCGQVLPRDANGLAIPQAPSAALNVTQFLHEAFARLDGAEARPVIKTLLNSFSRTSATMYAAVVEPYADVFLCLLSRVYSSCFEEQDQELARIAEICVAQLASLAITGPTALHLVRTWEALLGGKVHVATPTVAAQCQATLWRSRNSLLRFIVTFLFRNQFFLRGTPELATLQHRALELLHDPQKEVREQAVQVVTLLVQLNDEAYGHALSKEFLQWCRTSLAPRSAGTPNGGNGELLHRLAGCLGLKAVAQAYPHTLPAFVPQILVSLAEHERDPTEIATTVKATFAQWWKSHQDMWEYRYRDVFSDEERDVVTGLVYSPSYYA